MSFEEITYGNNWFKNNPHKVAGIEFETTSMFFPIQVKGTKEDVLRVVYGSEKINVAKAKALALKLKLKMI